MGVDPREKNSFAGFKSGGAARLEGNYKMPNPKRRHSRARRNRRRAHDHL